MRSDFQNIAKLGFGCMRLPLLDANDQQSIDLEQFTQMVDAFIEGGGTYFDTAFVYHEGASEKALGEALVKRYPRDAYTVATKCLAWASPHAEEAKSNLGTSLERMGLDYVDFYLLHNVGGERTAKFDEYGTVSYTHLDVYKRQRLSRAASCGLRSSGIPLSCRRIAPPGAYSAVHPTTSFANLRAKGRAVRLAGAARRP